MRYLVAYGWDDHYYRLLGTQLDPAFAGAILLITFFLTFNMKYMHWRSVLQTLIVVGMGLTFSRATYLAFTLSLVFFIGLNWRRGRKKLWHFVYLPLLILVIFLAPKPTGEGVNLTRTSTIVSRVTNTNQVIQQTTPAQWLLGGGMFVSRDTSMNDNSNAGLADHANVPDNLIVTMISGLGIIGVGILLAALWSAKKNIAMYPVWTLALFLGILIHSQFNNTVFQPFIWLMLMGIGFEVERNRRECQLTAGNSP
jgi:hypothetical protein